MLTSIQTYTKSLELRDRSGGGEKFRLGEEDRITFHSLCGNRISGFAITYSLCLLTLTENSTFWNYAKALVSAAYCLFHERISMHIIGKTSPD